MIRVLLSEEFTAIINSSNVYFYNTTDGSSSKLFEQEEGKEIDIDDATFSPTHQLLAVLFSDKSLKIWQRSKDRSWEKVKDTPVDRRSLTLAFNTDETSVYVGDKCGNVFKFQVIGGGDDEAKNPPVLGHVSMLLNLSCTEDYIMSAERDEKIRVTEVLRPYVIQSYLLGHQEFVCCCLPVCKDRKLVSTSGDGSIKLWELESGEELDSVQLISDVSSSVADIVCELDNVLVVASCNNSTVVHVFSIESENKLEKKFDINLPDGHVALACDFVKGKDDNRLYVLTAHQNKYDLLEFGQLNALSKACAPGSVDSKLQDFIRSTPFSSKFTDYSGHFKQKNVQNQRYKKFFDMIKKRAASGDQNENGYIKENKRLKS